MRLSNIEMEKMVRSLKPLLSHRNMVGYAAARNTRIINDALTEYAMMRDGLVERYGEPEIDAGGNQTGLVTLRPGTDGFARFAEEIEPFMAVEHDVEVFRIDIAEAIGCLSGEEILAADWMFVEEAGIDGALR